MTDKTPYEKIARPFYYDKEYRPTIRIDSKQITDLFNLVGNMNINEIKQYMIIEQIPYSIVDVNNNTLIHRVLLESDLTKSEIQRLQMIKFLYNENVNPDGPNNNNLTPLHIACSKQYHNIIKYLIQIGVNINYQDNFGNTPLHRLFSGSIKIEEKTTIGNLIPKPKKKDLLNIEIWKKARKDIWNDIEKSQFIEAIDNTIKSSIDSDNEEIDVVKDFQQQLSQIAKDLNLVDDVKKIKELQAININKFKTIIEKRWRMFPTIEDINIHSTMPFSYPDNDLSGFSVIKNANSNEFIKGKLYKNIEDVLSLLRSFQSENILFDSSTVNNNLLYNYIQEHKTDLDAEHIDINNYNEFNKQYAITNSYDYADNLINTKDNTFIGGARVILINNNFTNEMYDTLFNNNKQIEKIIPTILYTLFTDFNTANGFDTKFDLLGNINDHYVELLYHIINRTHTQEHIDRIKNILAVPPHRAIYYKIGIVDLLDNLKPETDIIGWMYCFINNIVCANRFEAIGRNESNLIGTIPLSIIYLIAGLINNKGGSLNNLILSISYCMRKSLYNTIYNRIANTYGFYNMINNDINNNIYNDLKISCSIVGLIYLIFAKDNNNLITNITNNRQFVANPNNLYTEMKQMLFQLINGFNESDELKFIMKYAFNIMNNQQPISSDMVIPTIFIKTFELNYTYREKLIKLISEYYNNLEQSPQNQMVADLIDLIRKKKSENDLEELIFDRLQNLIPTIYSEIELLPDEIETIINPNLDAFIATMNNSTYFKIIGDNKKAKNIWNLINTLPSRVNYYLAKPQDKEDPENIIYYTLKFIESYYLGLNFLGQIDFTIINNEMEAEEINYITNYNLFNFDITPAMNINNNIQLFYIYNNKYLYRPINAMNVVHTLLNIETNLNAYIKILIDRLMFMFNNMNKDKAVKLYSSFISYLYPDLLVLNNYSKIFKKLNNNFSSYKEIFDEIKEIDFIDTDINKNINDFSIFNLSKFEFYVNNINGSIYLLYYFNAATNRIKIPSFIYHTLVSNETLFSFDDDTQTLNILESKSNTIEPDTNTSSIKKNGHINREIGFFNNVINNIGFLTKEILKQSFITSKNSKLPPSLSIVLDDFYRLNIIETIKNNKTIINDKLITNLSENKITNNIQLLYLKSTIIEELIKLYFKNKTHQYAAALYNKIVKEEPYIKISSIDINSLFETYDFSVELNSKPSDDFIKNLNIDTEKELVYYYSFVESKKIKEQFFIYPDNYFGSNLLKTKYTINIDDDIIKLMLENNSNILLHNNEKISPLVMMVKNYYYKAFDIIKKNFDLNNYNKNNHYSPQYYLIETFKDHLSNYFYKISENQYNEMLNIIQSNEAYNNNILKYMSTSFDVVKHIVHQYLSENMIRFSNDFNLDDLKNILKICEIDENNIKNFGKCSYNENLGSNIIIPNKDEYIIIKELIDELTIKIEEANKILTKYKSEKVQLISLRLSTTNIDSKIFNINLKIVQYNDNKKNLEISYNKSNIVGIKSNINDIKIIKRYDNLCDNIDKISYMEGWKQYINRVKINNIEVIPLKLILIGKNKILENINILHKFYKLNHDIIKTYFENQRYIENNKVLNFVYDLLVHLTKTFICSNIEYIIKKVLYEYINNIQNITNTTSILNQIDYMTNGILKQLYEIIPHKFVSNSVNIYKNNDEEVTNQLETTAEILNNLIDLLKTSSSIPINDYTINILKNNIVPYFDTITYKLINNWNVVIENIFLFHINHYRMLECFKSFQ